MAFEEKQLSNGLFDRNLHNLTNMVDKIKDLIDQDVQKVLTFVENTMPTEQEVNRALTYLPKERREYATEKFGKFLKEGGYAIQIGKAYIQVEAARNTVAEYMKIAYKQGVIEQFVRSNPAYQGVVRKPEDFETVYRDLSKRASIYRKALAKTITNFIKDGIDIDNKIIKHYSKNKPATHAENFIAIGMSIGFASLVLYTLSQINPENVTVGAFTAGAGSSMLLAMLSAVVIFLLFFLTHHKLR